MNLEDALEDFNNGEFDKWLQVFGSYDIWFRLLKKRGLLDEVDPHNASDNEVWQNEYLLWLYEDDKASYYKWVGKFLEDVIFENSKAYLEVHERGDLSKLFCNGNRNDLSKLRDIFFTTISINIYQTSTIENSISNEFL